MVAAVCGGAAGKKTRAARRVLLSQSIQATSSARYDERREGEGVGDMDEASPIAAAENGA
jgi:hypothetical protein